MHVMDSTQDMLAFDSMASTGGASTTFRVRKDFVPAVSTKVSEKVLDVASPVFDDVTSGVADADSYWVPDLELQARGYYFDGLDTGDVGNVITRMHKRAPMLFLRDWRLWVMSRWPMARPLSPGWGSRHVCRP